MKAIIAGGRDYRFTGVDHARLDELRESLPITEVVCGMYGEADLGGKLWAEMRGIPVAPFPPDWIAFGRKAGPIRNSAMIVYCVENPPAALIVFPGNTGTADVTRKALKAGLQVIKIDTREA